jgi:hypothetical protein
LKKKWGKEKPGVTRMTQRVDPARPVANPLTFVFFLLKRRRFDFLKKKIDPGDPVIYQNPEPGPWIGPATRPGLKTMLQTILFVFFFSL